MLLSVLRVAVTGLAFSLPISATVPSLPGWSLTWSDDFEGKPGTLPSSSNWIIDTGTSYPGAAIQWGTGEVETYTASTKNLYQKGGDLYITPLRSSTGAWTSGRIETRRDNFKAQPGHKMKIQARIAMPDVGVDNGLGYWPAFWTMGHAFRGNYTNWPAVGEFDMMENINGLNSIQSGLHCGVDPGGPCNEPSGLGEREPCRGSNCNGNFHTYSVVVDRSTNPEQIRFFTDGQVRREVTSVDIGSHVWNQTMHDGYFILLNVAMGGAYPNFVANLTTPTAETISGKSMIVRYVAVYEQ